MTRLWQKLEVSDKETKHILTSVIKPKSTVNANNNKGYDLILNTAKAKKATEIWGFVTRR